MSNSRAKLRFIDIGVNLTDAMFKGVYNSKKYHQEDVAQVLERAWAVGMDKIMVTAGTLSEAMEALEICKSNPKLFTTVGVHPTRCMEFVPKSPEEGEESAFAADYLQKLIALAKKGKEAGKVVAVGEFGLDYERLQFCSKEVQQKYFDYQFAIAEATGLPLFLHNRESTSDLLEILAKNKHRWTTGVVHSFTGTKEELKQILSFEKKLYIGINGCSLKTNENLEVVKEIPADRLMIETDAPWCDIRSSHASSKFVKTKFEDRKKEKFELGKNVKSRNEPCNIQNVMEAIAGCRGEDIEALSDQIYKNTQAVFFPE